MALSSKHQIRLITANDTGFKTKSFERDNSGQEVSRTDLVSQYGGKFTVTATKSITTTLLNVTDISVVRAIYVESDNPVTVSLLDDTGSVNEITALVLAGPAGAGACKFFAEIAGFTIAASDTFVLTAGASDCVVTFALWGDTVTEA